MNPAGRFLSHLLFCCSAVLSAVSAQASTYYVWTNSPANGPGRAWSHAFHDKIIADTEPTNAASELRINGAAVGPAASHVLTWPSVTNRWYAVDKGTNLTGGFWLLESGIAGTPPVNSYTDAASIARAEFYRVTVSTGRFEEGMVLIPGGSNSGTNPLAADESYDPAAYPSNYSLTVSAFYMDRCLVTKTQWDDAYNWATNHGYQFENPGGGKRPSHPVQKVSWEDCVKWCNARGEQEGRPACYRIGVQIYRAGPSAGVTCDFAAKGYRLPTDAEWEFAGRGGLTGKRFPWGDTIDRRRANYYGSPADLLYDLGNAGFDARYNDRAYPYTSPVASFPPNGYGLYDMAGNVWEWCWDWYPGHENADRVVRGSSWYMTASNCRVGFRFNGKPFEECIAVGFRTVLPSGL